MPISTILVLAAIVLAIAGVSTGACVVAGLAVGNESVRLFFSMPANSRGRRDTYTIPSASVPPRAGRHPEEDL